jgi:hypothetical protein
MAFAAIFFPVGGISAHRFPGQPVGVLPLGCARDCSGNPAGPPSGGPRNWSGKPGFLRGKKGARKNNRTHPLMFVLIFWRNWFIMSYYFCNLAFVQRGIL